MSGGHFGYNQFRIDEIANEIEHLIATNGGEYRDYSKETIDQFKIGLSYLKFAAIYAQRIDWLVSGDYGEESFHKRLQEELTKLK